MTINGVGNGNNYLKQAASTQSKGVEAEALEQVKQQRDGAPKRLDPSGTFNKSDQGGKESRTDTSGGSAEQAAATYDAAAKLKEGASDGPPTSAELFAQKAEEGNQVGIKESFGLASSPLDKDGDGSLSLEEAIVSPGQEKSSANPPVPGQETSGQLATKAQAASAVEAYQEMEILAQLEQGSPPVGLGGTAFEVSPTDSLFSADK